MSEVIRMDLQQAWQFAVAACLKAGASAGMADVLAEATIAAEVQGVPAVGFAHLPDYLHALRLGGIDGHAEPTITRPLPCIIQADANRGIAQQAFAQAKDDIIQTTRDMGMVLFTCRNSFTTGELGFYVRTLAEAGLVALAATNGPALITVPGANRKVYCTNPIAFGAPRHGEAPIVIDQSSSATAFVSVRAAAAEGHAIPAGWAIDKDGNPTTDAKAALDGALLTFGGTRGANIALMVELMAAGLSGAEWSMDCNNYGDGDKTLGSGLSVIAIQPPKETDTARRVDDIAGRLAATGVHIPGEAKAHHARKATSEGITIPLSLHTQLA